jgi:uncharacterized membrane protein
VSANRPDRAGVGDRGGVMPIVAICLGLIVVSGALAVDLGRFSVSARGARNVADLAALDVVRILDGSTTAAQQATADAAATRSALRNGFDPGTDGSLGVVLGDYDRSTRTFVATAPDEVPNAVRIDVVGDSDNLLVPGSFSATRSAIATTESGGVAGIGLATATVAIDATRDAVLDALLSDVLGAPVDLAVADWQALADATVTLGDLASIGLGLDPTAVDGLLATAWSVGALLDALASMPLPPDAAGALTPLVGLGPDPYALQLADVIQADLAQPGAHRFGLSVVDLLQAAAMSAALGHTVDLDLAGTLGLAAGPTSALILAAPQLAIGGVGTTARSAEVLVQVDATLLAPLAIDDLEPATVQLPFTVQSAPGTATVAAIGCSGTPEAASVDVSVTTAAAMVRLARPTGPLGSGTFSTATLATLRTPPAPPDPAVDVLRIDADTSVAGVTTTSPLTFAPAYAWQPTEAVSVSGAAGAVIDLVPAQLDLVELGASPVPPASVAATLLDTLVNPALEDVVPPLLQAFGVPLGSADVSVPLATCHTAALVG